MADLAQFSQRIKKIGEKIEAGSGQQCGQTGSGCDQPNCDFSDSREDRAGAGKLASGY